VLQRAQAADTQRDDNQHHQHDDDGKS
jgi:hypothetical protein